MSPKTKTILIVVGMILCAFLVPILIVLLREYINFFVLFVSVTLTLVIFGIGCYEEIYPIIYKDKIEDDEAFHRFHGDPEKMRFYKGFKMFFKGDLSSEGLKHWLMHHHVKR